jgi:hypothetical protein
MGMKLRSEDERERRDSSLCLLVAGLHNIETPSQITDIQQHAEILTIYRLSNTQLVVLHAYLVVQLTGLHLVTHS